MIKISLSKIRGIGLIFYKRKYYALWLEWADGGIVQESGELKPLWITPRIRFVHT